MRRRAERPGFGHDSRAILGRDVRSFQMVHDQAPEGRQRRQARRHLHQGRPGDRRRGPDRRRRPRCATTGSGWRSRRRAAVNMPAENIKRAIEQGDRRRRGRAVRGDRLRGLRPGRRGDPGRGGHRQPQPDRGRGPLDVRQVGRPAGRHGRRRLAVRAARPDHGPPRRRSTRTRSPSAAIDAGAEDVDTAADPLEIYTAPADLEAVRQTLEDAGVTVESAESAMIAKQTVELDALAGPAGPPPGRAARGSRRRAAGDGQLRHPGGRLRRSRRIAAGPTAMIVLGIDPGTAALGYGVVEKPAGRLRSVDFGCVATIPAEPLGEPAARRSTPPSPT